MWGWCLVPRSKDRGWAFWCLHSCLTLPKLPKIVFLKINAMPRGWEPCPHLALLHIYLPLGIEICMGDAKQQGLGMLCSVCFQSWGGNSHCGSLHALQSPPGLRTTGCGHCGQAACAHRPCAAPAVLQTRQSIWIHRRPD